MKRIAAHPIGIDQGTQLMFSDFANDGPMWAGTGPRESRKWVSFDEAFLTAPAVMVGISMWDMDRRGNLRADISAENVTNLGFDLVFKTWGDTRVARVRADWTAVGPLYDEETWDLT